MSRRRHRASSVERLEVRRLLSTAPSLDVSFEGQARDNVGLDIRPDCAIGVGPSNVLTVTNGRVRWTAKDGTAQYDQSLSTFFGFSTDVGIADPQAFYDPFAGQFIVTAQAGLSLLVATSTGSTLESSPTLAFDTTDWDVRDIEAPDDIDTGSGTFANIIDQPRFSVTGDALYVVAEPSNLQSRFKGLPAVWVVPKAALHSSGPESTVLGEGTDYAAFYNQFSLGTLPMPVQPGPGSPFPTGVGDYLVAGNDVTVVHFDSNLANVTLSTTFALRAPDISNDDATVATLDPNAGSMKVVMADFSERPVWHAGYLYFAHDLYPPPGTPGAPNGHEDAVLWSEFLAPTAYADQTDSSKWRLFDSGLIGAEELGANTKTGYPAIAVDAQGDIAVGFTATGPNIYAGAYYAVHRADDAPGTMSAPAELAAGQGFWNMDAPYEGSIGEGGSNWGDYSGIAVDPSDGNRFWIYNQYVKTYTGSDSNYIERDWGTRVGSFVMPDSPSVVLTQATALTGPVYVRTDPEDDTQGQIYIWDGASPFDASTATLLTTYDLASSDPLIIRGGTNADVFTIDESSSVSPMPAAGMLLEGDGGSDKVIVIGTPTDSSGVLTGSGFTDASGTIGLQAFSTFEWDAAGGDTLTVDRGATPAPLPANVGFDDAGTGNTLTVDLAAPSTVTVFSVPSSSSSASSLTAQTTGQSDTLTISFTGTTAINYLNRSGGSDSLADHGPIPLQLLPGIRSGPNPMYFSNLKLYNDSGNAKIVVMSAASHANRSVLVIDSGGLSFFGDDMLDLRDNDMIVQGGTYSQIDPLVTAGFNGGLWDGTGITSTKAAIVGGTAIGFARASDLGATTFDGVNVAGTDMVVKYTYYGDATLDGQVESSDYSVIDFFNGMSSGAVWAFGDFNFDGKVDPDDYSLIDILNGAGTSGNSNPRL
jgi:hypothetical protein